MAELSQALTEALRRERPRIVAGVLRLCGDLELAEDAVHEAALAALQAWLGGVPSNPAAWLTTAAKRVALDALRHQRRAAGHLEQLAASADDGASETDSMDCIVDDYLRLLFTCCDPTLGLDARIALTLKVVVGFSTEQIARAFLTSEATVSQRILRAKRTLRERERRYEPPSEAELPERVGSVLGVLYALLNEGHTSASGPLMQGELVEQATRLSRLVCDLVPEEREAFGLLALSCFTHARSQTRVDDEGVPILLAHQQRAQWDHRLLREGLIALHYARSLGDAGPYLLQAEIAAVHVTAPSWDQTDWDAIVNLYDALIRLEPSAVVALNRAIALAMRDGPESALVALAALESKLASYHLFFATRADLLQRLGRDSSPDLRKALELTSNLGERRLLEKRLLALKG